MGSPRGGGRLPISVIESEASESWAFGAKVFTKSLFLTLRPCGTDVKMHRAGGREGTVSTKAADTPREGSPPNVLSSASRLIFPHLFI